MKMKAEAAEHNRKESDWHEENKRIQVNGWTCEKGQRRYDCRIQEKGEK